MSGIRVWYEKPSKLSLVRKSLGSSVRFRAAPERAKSSVFLSKSDQKSSPVRKTLEIDPGTQKKETHRRKMACSEIGQI